METSIKIHPSAQVNCFAQIGEGTIIWQNSIIMEKAVIGKNCTIGANVFIEDNVLLGNCVKVKNNVALYSGLKCEDNVFLGPGCVFTNVINPRSFINRKSEFKSTYVKKGATIGANATILCGHVIGNYAMIGAGAVVTKNVKDYELVAGNPARCIGYVCQCGVTLVQDNLKYVCHECGKHYVMSDNELSLLKKNTE